MTYVAKTNTLQIQCVTKTDRHNPWERITHVGGQSNGGWKITQEDAIRHIETRTWDFFVVVRGNRVQVIVSTSRFGNKYLKTVGDGDHQNDLLSLPECR